MHLSVYFYRKVRAIIAEQPVCVYNAFAFYLEWGPMGNICLKAICGPLKFRELTMKPTLVFI